MDSNIMNILQRIKTMVCPKHLQNKYEEMFHVVKRLFWRKLLQVRRGFYVWSNACVGLSRGDIGFGLRVNETEQYHITMVI